MGEKKIVVPGEKGGGYPYPLCEKRCLHLVFKNRGWLGTMSLGILSTKF